METLEFFFIFVMTISAIGLFLVLIATSQDSNLYSLRNNFMAIWLYYGFSVGVDLIVGFRIPPIGGEPDLCSPSNWRRVAFVMGCYWACGIAFLLTYVMSGKLPARPLEKRYGFNTPPLIVLLVVHVLAIRWYSTLFFSMSRMERLSMQATFASYKLAGLMMPALMAIDIMIVLCDRRKAPVAWALGVLAALITGDRAHVLIMLLVAAFRWRPSVRGWKLVGIATAGLLIGFTFKAGYAVALDWWAGERVALATVAEHTKMSLAALDADASYVIAMFYTDRPSPWWLGRSYWETPILMSWPRFLGGLRVATLAENYVWEYHSRIASRGGSLAFSAIAESWLNFSCLGPVLLGCFWGAITRFFDSRPRGVIFFMLLFMSARLFRSDFASIYKNWVLVWGLLFLVAWICLHVYSLITTPKPRSTVHFVNPSSTGRSNGTPVMGNVRKKHLPLRTAAMSKWVPRTGKIRPGFLSKKWGRPES